MDPKGLIPLVAQARLTVTIAKRIILPCNDLEFIGSPPAAAKPSRGETKDTANCAARHDAKRRKHRLSVKASAGEDRSVL
jgi:hypothetical protein